MARTTTSDPAGAACCDAPTTISLPEPAAVALAAGFHALADPARLRILRMLAEAPRGEVCVCDFVGPLARSQPTVSHHLKVLHQAGLVRAERRGKWVWYSLVNERMAQLHRELVPTVSRLGERREVATP